MISFSKKNLLAIYTAATVLQVIIVALSLIFIYRQTYLSRNSVESLSKSYKHRSYMQHREQIFEHNALLLSHPELARKMGLSKENILAYILINWAEMAYIQKKDDLTTDTVWAGQDSLMKKAASFEFVQKLWPVARNEVSPEFAIIFDGIVKSSADVE